MCARMFIGARDTFWSVEYLLECGVFIGLWGIYCSVGYLLECGSSAQALKGSSVSVTSWQVQQLLGDS